jgi:hypothetical protein
MANPLDFLNTTNYPSSFLEGTFGDKFYSQTVNPAKLGTGPKPSLGTLAKNWNPLKAFTPKMLKTGPTLAAKTFLKSSGIGTLAGMFLDPTVANADEVEWAQQLMMDRRATQEGIAKVAMQKQIQQAEAAQAAAQQAAQARRVRQNIQTYGNRDRPNTGMNTPGGGKGQSPTGGDVAGTPFDMGGLVYLLYGGLV